MLGVGQYRATAVRIPPQIVPAFAHIQLVPGSHEAQVARCGFECSQGISVVWGHASPEEILFLVGSRSRCGIRQPPYVCRDDENCHNGIADNNYIDYRRHVVDCRYQKGKPHVPHSSSNRYRVADLR